jgi:hypothetical protein
MPGSAKKRHQASLRKSSRKLRAQLHRLSVDYSMQAGYVRTASARFALCFSWLQQLRRITHVPLSQRAPQRS